MTQRQWKRVVGKFPGELTAGAGYDFPVYAINFAEAVEFCRKLTVQARQSGELPAACERWKLPVGDAIPR